MNGKEAAVGTAAPLIYGQGAQGAKPPLSLGFNPFTLNVKK
ncbi:MAG: hypothetical protein PHR56_01265 [Dehalococcoidales bacterium]|nr:hypothetical protein [Dehalococcoidales bacterium]